LSNIKHHSKRESPRSAATPSAPKGKNVSPFKAILDVLKEEAVVLPDEDMRAYEELRLGFFQDLSPQNSLEEQRVQILVDTAWRKKRCFALENSLFALEYAAPAGDREAASKLLTEQIKAMDKISRHEARLSRLWDTAWNELRKMQADRKKVEQKPILHLVQ
jgi:hypothetical protein